MDILKIFLVFTVFWRQGVFGSPARQPRSLKKCKASFKQAYSNNLQDMETYMKALFHLTTSKPTQPTIMFPPSYVAGLTSTTKTMERLVAYFKEMDKYTAYLSSGRIASTHGSLLQTIKNVGNSVEKYCNCPSAHGGKKYFISTTHSTPVKSLTQKDKQYVHYKIRTSLRDIYKKHNSKSPIQCH